jgi:DNA-binding CsgD family transcriptional regulator
VDGGATALVGRDLEIARVTDAIARAGTATRRLLIAGEAGIGKTSLLRVALHQADVQGHRVLAAWPTRAESQLPFAVLTDLLRDVRLDALDPPERRVLEVAIGRRDGDGNPPFANQLGFAVVSVAQALAGDGPPLVVAIDDVQWVDAASREVLEFALRRLPPSGVCVVMTQRTNPADRVAASPLITGPGGELLDLAPLPRDATEQVVRSALPGNLPKHVVQRVVSVAAGNPLYAIEFGRAAIDAVMQPGRPLPIPDSLAAVMATRFEGLPPPALEALAAVAMLARPSIDVLDELGLLDELHPAEVADMVEVRARRVAFTHPVLAAAAYDAVAGTRRLDLHRRLASVTSGTERWIHLGLGARRPDHELATELTRVAQHEMARGAPAEAAEIGLLALDVTPADDPERSARLVAVADLLFRAGRTDEAVELVREVLEDTPDDPLRARALLTLATIEFSRSADAEVAARLARECLDVATDPDLRAEAHSILARADYLDFVAAAEHADAALDLVRDRPGVDGAVLAAALTASAATRFNAGQGLDRAGLLQAIELERGTNVIVSDSAYATLAALLKYADDLDGSQAMFDTLTHRSDPGSLPYALGHLPQLHLWSGRWDEAERCARQHLAIAEQTHQESQIETARFNLAVVAAHRGLVRLAEPVARALVDEGRAHEVPWTERIGQSLLGFLAMSTGDAHAAALHFARYDELAEAMRLYEPGYCRFHGDYIEALVATGEHGRAAEVIERISERAERLQRVTSLAVVHRGRALLAAHAADREAAIEQARAAVERLDGTPLRYDLARARLTLGVVYRRFQERALARQALERALEDFQTMGASSLAERARRERDRVSGRAPARPVGHAVLTPTETSVAELAATGRTTREIAEALYISAKTVEANLTRVYRKLGVANRAQLANHMAARGAGRSEAGSG